MITSSKQNLTFLNQTPALDNFSKQNLLVLQEMAYMLPRL